MGSFSAASWGTYSSSGRFPCNRHTGLVSEVLFGQVIVSLRASGGPSAGVGLLGTVAKRAALCFILQSAPLVASDPNAQRLCWLFLATQ